MTDFYPILVLDDDVSVLTALQQVMEREGYEVLMARDGPEALALAREKPPNLVLCDYRMPEMNGVQVFKAMLNICPDAIPILVKKKEKGKGRSGCFGFFIAAKRPFRMLAARGVEGWENCI